MMTRMELMRVIKGPGAVSYGPQTVGGAIDLVTRSIPDRRGGRRSTWRSATFGYGKVHGFFGASTARARASCSKGSLCSSSGYKEIDDGGGDTGFEKNEWMWKGRYLLSTDPNASQSVGLKLGYSDEDSRESYLGLTDADLRANPNRRYRASRFDRMQWHRTQIVRHATTAAFARRSPSTPPPTATTSTGPGGRSTASAGRTSPRCSADPDDADNQNASLRRADGESDSSSSCDGDRSTSARTSASSSRRACR